MHQFDPTHSLPSSRTQGAHLTRDVSPSASIGAGARARAGAGAGLATPFSTRAALVTYSALHPREPLSDEHAALLYRMHAVLALVHGVAAILLGVLVPTTLGERGQVPVSLTFHDRPGAAYGRTTWTLDTALLLPAAPIGYWIVAFLCMAALDHAYTVWRWAAYEGHVAQRRNPYRYAEYTLSFATMSAVIIVLCGGLDGFQIAFAFVLSSACIAFGWANEALADGRSAWLALASWLCLALVWSANIVLVAHSPTATPGFVWPILGVLLVLEASFGLVPWIGRERAFWKQEVAFGALSLLAKQLLAWMTYAGVRSLPSY